MTSWLRYLTCACTLLWGALLPSRMALAADEEWVGWQSRTTRPDVSVARSETDWAFLWERVGSPAPPVPLPADRLAIGIFLGIKPTPAYGITFHDVEIRDCVAVVRFSEHSPRPGTIGPQVIATPFLIRILPATAGPIIFEKTGPNGNMERLIPTEEGGRLSQAAEACRGRKSDALPPLPLAVEDRITAAMQESGGTPASAVRVLLEYPAMEWHTREFVEALSFLEGREAMVESIRPDVLPWTREHVRQAWEWAELRAEAAAALLDEVRADIYRELGDSRSEAGERALVAADFNLFGAAQLLLARGGKEPHEVGRLAALRFLQGMDSVDRQFEQPTSKTNPR